MREHDYYFRKLSRSDPEKFKEISARGGRVPKDVLKERKIIIENCKDLIRAQFLIEEVKAEERELYLQFKESLKAQREAERREIKLAKHREAQQRYLERKRLEAENNSMKNN